jgi:hypothetical protein
MLLLLYCIVVSNTFFYFFLGSLATDGPEALSNIEVKGLSLKPKYSPYARFIDQPQNLNMPQDPTLQIRSKHI